MKIDFDEKIVLKKLIYHVTSCKMLPRQTADAALILAMLPAKNGRLLSHLSFPKWWVQKLVRKTCACDVVVDTARFSRFFAKKYIFQYALSCYRREIWNVMFTIEMGICNGWYFAEEKVVSCSFYQFMK